MKPKCLLLGSFLSLALLAPDSHAQRRDTWDQNGDGRISRDEWTGNARAFNQRDRNRDGYLDRDELPPALRDRVGIQGQADRQRPYDQGRTQSSPTARLDKNRSGVVEGYEWPYNKQVFHELDRDRNSVLSRDELAQISTATMIQLDRNNNQRIDPSEWPGGFAEFDQLDKDGDGVISSAEYFERGGEWQRRQRFDEWDKDKDGIVSSTEWRSRPDLFHRLDTNGDGRLNWDEFMASTERYENPFGWHYGDEKRYRR
jgi:Ca2+-binding EF-hand superfamily protein